MKIAINAVSAKMSGSLTYLAGLLQHLPCGESGYEFFVFLPRGTATKLANVRWNVKLCRVPRKYSSGWRRLWWDQITLRRFLRREKVDALFSSANFGMFRCPVRQILLVRNALYFSKMYQEVVLGKHGLGFRLDLMLRRWMNLMSVRGADVVMTPTHAMLDELARFVNVASRNASVNYYGVDQPEMPAEDISASQARASPEVVRLVYVSLYSDNKNLSTLLKAMPLLNAGGPRKFLLKTTVNPAWRGAAWTVTYKDDLALARQPDVAPWVEFLRPLGKREVQQLYRDADVLVFPSFCESFGHPMVEAMANGLPVVASDTPVNREICGDAAVYFRPLDPQDLAQKVRLLGCDEALRGKLGAAGRRRAAACFRWEDHVGRLLHAFGNAGSGGLGSA
jgi:glycosyltransferase involved in cell wall biosynthesis